LVHPSFHAGDSAGDEKQKGLGFSPKPLIFLAPLRQLIQERFAYSSTGGAQDDGESNLTPLRPIPLGESIEER
jgi:hypothetical protein